MSNLTTTEITETAVFETFPQTDHAVHKLLDLGVSPDRISVVCRDRHRELSSDVETIGGSVFERRLPAVLTGGAIGTVFGGAAAAAGVTMSGGIGLLVLGPLLGGAAAAGVTGGFVGAMISRGLEPDEADLYDLAIKRGAILVAVEPSEEPGEPSQEHVARALQIHGGRSFAA